MTMTTIYRHGDSGLRSNGRHNKTMDDKRTINAAPRTAVLIFLLRPLVDSMFSLLSLIALMSMLMASCDASSASTTTTTMTSSTTSLSSTSLASPSSSSSYPSLSSLTSSSSSTSMSSSSTSSTLSPSATSSSSSSSSSWQIEFFRSSDVDRQEETDIVLCQYELINEAELLINCDPSSSAGVAPTTPGDAAASAVDVKDAALNLNSMEEILDVKINFNSSLETLVIRNAPLRSANLGAILSLAHLDGLKRLDLSVNCLENLYNNFSGDMAFVGGSFSNAKRYAVIFLDLSRNKLERLERNSFQHLEHLQVLDLSYNSLSTLERTLFYGLASLNELRLSNNLLSSLDAGFLIDCPLLEILDLSGNSLADIPAAIFEKSVVLKVLIISKNSFQKFPSTAVSTLKHLEYLDFGGNPTRRLESETVSSLWKLRELKINSMPELEIVEANALKDLPSLNAIFMGDNKKLAYIDSQAFVTCHKINDLHLQNNKLVTIDERFINSIGELQFLDVSNNHLTCDCNIAWLAEMIKKCSEDDRKYHPNNETSCPKWATSIISHHPVLCREPPHFMGRMLADVVDELLNQDHPQTTATTTTLKPNNYGSSKPHPPTRETLPQSSKIDQSRRGCPPVIAPLFTRAIHLAIGEPLYLECRAIGKSKVVTSWHFTGLGSRNHYEGFDDLINNSRRRIVNVSGVTPQHAGLYTCMAESLGETGSKQTSNVTVKIFNRNATVYPTSLSRTTVTVEWTGTETTMNTAEYYLTCRRMIEQKMNFVPAEHVGRVRRHSGRYFHPSSLFAKHAKPFSTSTGLPRTQDQPKETSSYDHKAPVVSPGSDHHTYLHQYPPYLSGEAASLAYVKLRLGPYMRRNTFNGLQPLTPYMICIAVCNSTERRPIYHHHHHQTDHQMGTPVEPQNGRGALPYQMDEEDYDLITLSCFQITTTDKNLPGFEQEPGIRKLPILQILLGAFGSLALTLTCCVVCRNVAANYAERVSRRRKCRGDDYKLVACRSERRGSVTTEQPVETAFIEKTKSLSRTSLLED